MNNLIERLLNNRTVVIAFGFLIVAGGTYSYKQLPVDAFPDVSPVLVQVFTVTEGLAPEEIERYVTFPVEVAMNGLPNLETIRSVSNFGLSVVNVYFEDGTDIYLTRQLVNERLTEAREQIPEGFGEPEMGPISTGMGLIMFYYLEDKTGNYSLTELRSIQDWIIKFQLQTVPGVTEVLGIGGLEKQYHVIVDPDALQRYDLTVNSVAKTLRENNLNVGAQFIEINAEEFIVRSTGLALGIVDLENITIKTANGIPIFLSQVAAVEIGGATRRGLQTHNGIEEVVSGMIVKLYGTNSSKVIGEVEAKLVEINSILPPGIIIKPYYEQKTLVTAAVQTVTSALEEGILLVSLILVLFLGAIRPSIVVAIAIPFSVLFTIIGMSYFGISANLMSFGGLAIAIGMIVDGSLVVVENVDRLLRTSAPEKSRTEVISQAYREVIRPIAFAVSIIVIVFLPLFTLQGVEGKMFRPLAYTIALAMTGSLLFAVTLAPVLAYVLMRRPKDAGHQEGEHQIWIVRALLRGYRPMVTYFVQHRHLAVSLALGLLMVGGAIYPRLGSEFTPTLQEGTIVVRLTMAPSISLTESTRITKIVEARVLRITEVVEVVSRIGRGEVGAHSDPINSAEMYVILKPVDEWVNASNQQELEDQIRAELGNIPGVLFNISQPIQMTVDELLEGVRAELAIKLYGDDLQILKDKADEIVVAINGVRGAADVQADQISGTPQLRIKIDRQAIARYGINVSDVQEVIHVAVGGEKAGQIFEGVRRYDILVRFAPDFRNTPAAIANILVEAPNGVHIPLSQLALIEEIVGPRQITRQNSQRFITIQANVIGRDIGSFVEEGQRTLEEEVVLPPGYLVTWGGQFRLQQEANKRLAVVIPVTLGIVFLLLFFNFNSLKNSILILLNIPLALVGGIVALWLSGQNLSVPASVGFIALFGIALLNGIVLVTYFNQILREGMSIDEASINGACLRVRPVIMTALAAGLGMVPLLYSSGIGSDVQRPLATVVIGGLITSTVLTLLVIPALYKWFAIDVES